MTNILLIADYGIGDPAFTEVTLALKTLLPEAIVHPQSVPAFSTLSTGFWIYQLARTPNLKNTYIYANTAPRKENSEAQKNNKGERLMYAKLQNGLEIMAVNAGYTFSFIKPYLSEFAYADVLNEGSQFRSRDFYPKAVYQMIKKEGSFLKDTVDPALIPDYPKQTIVSIDGYGNLKTTTRQSEVTATSGQSLLVELNGVKEKAVYTDGVFNVPSGQLAFAPGSSGYEDRFMELFVRGASAYKLFNSPQTEEAFTLLPY